MTRLSFVSCEHFINVTSLMIISFLIWPDFFILLQTILTSNLLCFWKQTTSNGFRWREFRQHSNINKVFKRNHATLSCIYSKSDRFPPTLRTSETLSCLAALGWQTGDQRLWFLSQRGPDVVRMNPDFPSSFQAITILRIRILCFKNAVKVILWVVLKIVFAVKSWMFCDGRYHISVTSERVTFCCEPCSDLFSDKEPQAGPVHSRPYTSFDLCSSLFRRGVAIATTLPHSPKTARVVKSFQPTVSLTHPFTREDVLRECLSDYERG